MRRHVVIGVPPPQPRPLQYRMLRNNAPEALDPRTPEFRTLFLNVLANLKIFIGTETSDIVLLSCSGTGAMEAAVSNLTSPGDRVLVLSAGRYGERWSGLAKNFGCAVDEVLVPDGETFSLDQVRSALKLETRAVFLQATEASTGVRHSVAAIAGLLHETESEALLVVDAITALRTTDLDMDRAGIDLLLGTSDRDLNCPPGASFLAVGPRAWDRMEATYNPRFYFDLRKYLRASRTGDSPYTPPTSLVAALDQALAVIAALAATPQNAAGDLAEGRCRMLEAANLNPAR